MYTERVREPLTLVPARVLAQKMALSKHDTSGFFPSCNAHCISIQKLIPHPGERYCARDDDL